MKELLKRNMNNIEIKINSASFDVLIAFYNENNENFNPPLNSQVKSIEKYVEKMKNNAVIFEAWNDYELIGLVAAYFNNYETKIGFITSVIVSKKYQKQGIAKILLEKTIDFAKEHGFEKIQLEVHNENKNAIELYKKFGFVEKTIDFISMGLDLRNANLNT